MRKQGAFITLFSLSLSAMLFPLVSFAKATVGIEDHIAAFLAGLMIGLGGTIASIGILIFNLAAKFGVLHFAETFGSIDIINTIWGGLRDLANIFLVFMFHFIGIATIIGNSQYGYKKLLVKLLLVALLINFSLFFVRAMIDLSHVFVEAIYNGFELTNADCGVQNTDCELSYGLGGVYAEQLGIVSFAKWPQDNLNIIARERDAKFIDIIAFGSMGFIFLTIAGIVFVAAGIILIGRIVALVYAMIMAPLAAAAYVLPQTKKFFDSWLNNLLKNAFIAPVLFLLLGLSLLFARGVFSAGSMNNLADALFAINTDESIFSSLIGFAVVIAFLLGSLKFAQDWGAAGAKTAINFSKSTGSFAARRTIGAAAGASAVVAQNTVGLGGRAASRAIRSSGLGRTEFGRGVLKTTDFVGQSSYDVRKVAGSTIRTGVSGLDFDVGRSIKGKDARQKELEKERKDHADTLVASRGEQRRSEALKAEVDAAKGRGEVTSESEIKKTIATAQEEAAADRQAAAARESTQRQAVEARTQQSIEQIEQSVKAQKEQIETSFNETVTQIAEETKSIQEEIRSLDREIISLAARNNGRPDTVEIQEKKQTAKALETRLQKLRNGDAQREAFEEYEKKISSKDAELQQLVAQKRREQEVELGKLQQAREREEEGIQRVLDARVTEIRARQQEFLDNQKELNDLEDRAQKEYATSLEGTPVLGQVLTRRDTEGKLQSRIPGAGASANLRAAEAIRKKYSSEGKAKEARAKELRLAVEEATKDQKKGESKGDDKGAESKT